MFCSFLFTAGLLLSLSVGQAEKQYLYVKPTPTSRGCPQDEVCMTLTEYLQNVSTFLSSFTTIHFLPGNHTISDHEFDRDIIVASNVQNVSLTGSANRTILYCAKRLVFAFMNVTNLDILNIRIINCGKTITNLLNVMDLNVDMHNTIHKETSAALVLVSTISLMLQNVRIEASYGYGLLGVRLLGASTIINCKFTHNMWRSDDADSSNTSVPYNETKPGGNALIILLPPPYVLYTIATLTVTISQCEFAYGIDATTYHWTKSNLRVTGSGLGIILYGQFQQHIAFIHLGLMALLMNISITDSVFHNNDALYGRGGNIFVLLHYDGYSRKINRTISINNCTFYNSKAKEGGGMFVGSTIATGRLRVTASASTSAIILSNSNITNNTARKGGGLSIKAANSLVPFFMIENCIFSGNKAIQGAAVNIIWSYIYDPRINVIISETTFLQNSARSGGAIYIDFRYFDHLEYHKLVTIIGKNCNFMENKAENGYAMSISDRKIDGKRSHSYYPISIQLFNMLVKNNGPQRYDEGNYCAAAFCIHNIEDLLLSNSTFVENNGSAVYINGSKLYISGVVNIIGNRGVSGGGLYFDCNPHSLMYLTPHSRVYLANNTASFHGGAIAARDCGALTVREQCFVNISDQHMECLPFIHTFHYNLTVKEATECFDTKVIMNNNTADIAGDSIYGGALETCHILLKSISSEVEFNPWTSIFEIKNKLSLSEVASDPFQVCFCDRSFNMNTSECIIETEAEVYHGQTLQIPAVGVGQFNNSSPSVIRTTITSSTGKLLLGERQNVQDLDRNCGLLTYLFIENSGNDNYSVELQILVEKAQQIFSPVPATVHVTIHKCPAGFELVFSEDLFKCDCEPHLKRKAIRCDIDDQKIYHPAAMWIGYYQDQVVLHTNCPFHYCKLEEDIGLRLDSQDDQCAFNHSGVLCGACQQGLSLALGTSQCLKCSNVYLLLTIPFALAGVVLVFLLLKCNLAVSVGSINGLIFYVNIIQANYDTFFPHGSQDMNIITKCCSIFIAWMNLDLGIQTCFFAGMNVYTKTWLQFVFPAYVWVMVGLMIYGSRHFPTVARLIGSNAVHVLATLFLLSYAKLLRTAIATVYSTSLTGRNSSTPLVWLLDGNIMFLRGKHTVLLLMALVVLLVYIIPFTMLVLLAPCLQAVSNYKQLRLIHKLKPLLDAYQGPYKDKFRYWTGLMLLLRIILFSAFAGNVLGKPEINLFAVIVMILLLIMIYWNTERIYKKLLWNITESFYLLNLAILTAVTLLLRSLDQNSSSMSQIIVTDIMVGTAFAVFCTIVLYHFCVYLFKISLIKSMRILFGKLCDHEQPTTGITTPSNNDTAHASHDNTYTVTNIELNLLREPLLSDT